jgi:hypothetical protein
MDIDLCFEVEEIHGDEKDTWNEKSLKLAVYMIYH